MNVRGVIQIRLEPTWLDLLTCASLPCLLMHGLLPHASTWNHEIIFRMEHSNDLRAQLDHIVHTTRNGTNVLNTSTGYFIKPASSIFRNIDVIYRSTAKQCLRLLTISKINRTRQQKQIENKAYNF